MQNKSKNLIQTAEEKQAQRKRQIRNWAILLGVIAFVAGAAFLISLFGGSGSSITALSLPCYAHQDVTTFQDGVLYYDGASIHFVNAGGSIEWSYPAGDGAAFSASDTHIIVWAGHQLSIVDSRGKSSYNRAMDEEIQFARIGRKHAAIVTGGDLTATVYIKDLQGSEIDSETGQFDGQLLLDCGFYGKSDEYLWTLSYDFYAPVVTHLLHTFQVGQMNTGMATINDHLPDKVIYVDNQLKVFTTQQMYAFDYKGVPDTSNTLLVYGWRYLDHYVPARGVSNMLLVPTKQTDTGAGFTEVRVLSSEIDRRYNLPTACVGAAIDNNRIFAFSSQYMYSGKVDSQRFYPHAIPLPDGRVVTDFLGLTDNGYAIVASNSEVYSVSLPK